MFKQKLKQMSEIQDSSFIMFMYFWYYSQNIITLYHAYKQRSEFSYIYVLEMKTQLCHMEYALELLIQK